MKSNNGIGRTTPDVSDDEIGKMMTWRADGLEVKEIARRLNRNVNTVSKHLRKATQKKGLHKVACRKASNGAARHKTSNGHQTPLVAASASIDELMELAKRLRGSYAKIVIDLHAMKYRARRITKNESGTIQ